MMASKRCLRPCFANKALIRKNASRGWSVNIRKKTGGKKTNNPNLNLKKKQTKTKLEKNKKHKQTKKNKTKQTTRKQNKTQPKPKLDQNDTKTKKIAELSSPYSDLIEIFSNCYPVGCFKTPKKEKQNPIQT